MVDDVAEPGEMSAAAARFVTPCGCSGVFGMIDGTAIFEDGVEEEVVLHSVQALA